MEKPEARAVSGHFILQSIGTIRNELADIEVADEACAAVGQFARQLRTPVRMSAWQVDLHPTNFVHEQSLAENLAGSIETRASEESAAGDFAHRGELKLKVALRILQSAQSAPERFDGIDDSPVSAST
jgi:hypothetical protein